MTAYYMRISDGSSDVCSTDIELGEEDVRLIGAQPHQCLGHAAERRLVVGEGGAQRSDHLGCESRPKVDHFGNRAAAAVEFEPVGGDSMDPVGVDVAGAAFAKRPGQIFAGMLL